MVNKTLVISEKLVIVRCVNFHWSPILRNEGGDDCSKKNESPLKRLLDDSASFDDVKAQNITQQWVTLPYGQDAKIRNEGPVRSSQDPRDTSIILFPGQGNQYVGMAKDLLKFPIVKDLFELANYVLKYDLLKLCLEGPKSKLNETVYCQPATMVSSLAALECLKEERPNAIENCVATAGFSLGELTALVFAGSIGFERALQLVKIRAEAMQLAGEAYRGGMVRVLVGADSKLNYACLKAKEWALEKGDEKPECCISNYLFPTCKIVAGSTEALNYLENNFKEYNLRKISRLPVSGAFHSSLMEPAVEVFRNALTKTDIQDPAIYVYSNVDGKKYKNAEHIRKQLPKQVSSRNLI